jgi:muramoyltetrapeptide carboxypeptidase
MTSAGARSASGEAGTSARRGARLPPPVRAGDRVGVAALSGPAEPRRLEAGLDALSALGFDPVPAANLRRRDGLFAGGDAERLAGFHELAADPDLAAIFFLRGGYGLMRLLPHLDWDLVARRPRAWVGYSDLTPFLLEVVRRTGVVAFHGPMVATDLARGLDAAEEESLLAALAGDLPRALPLSLAEEDRHLPDVAGPLLGGCLSLLTSTLGTPWAPRLDGALVFVEDVEEPLYRLDRMLTHLRLSGRLTSIRAMIFGHLGCLDAPHPDPAACVPQLRQGLAELRWPVAWGLPAGHGSPNHTLPLGLHCRLEPQRSRLVLGAGEEEAR